jgi:hypothetical protein
MKIQRYEFEVTTFVPDVRHEHFTCKHLSQAIAALKTLPTDNAVIYVAALGDGVDCGNFYCFLNDEGVAHIMLHEHREFFPEDPSTQVNNGEMRFRDEDGICFAVEARLTTSAARAKEALAHWLPNQAHIGRNSYGNKSADAT